MFVSNEGFFFLLRGIKYLTSHYMSLKEGSARVLLCAALKVGSVSYDIVVFAGRMNWG